MYIYIYIYVICILYIYVCVCVCMCVCLCVNKKQLIIPQVIAIVAQASKNCTDDIDNEFQHCYGFPARLNEEVGIEPV